MALHDAEEKPIRGSQLQDLETVELQAELQRLKEARVRLTFRAATEPLDNPMQFRTLRRNIARIETVLRQRVNA